MTKQNQEQKNGWDDWAVKTQKSVIVGGKSFTIQELSGDEYDEISRIPRAVPPKKFKTDDKGNPIVVNKVAQTEEDYDDPGYIKQAEEIEIKRALLILKYGLVSPDGANIPGETDQDKWEYLKRGVAGIMEKLTFEILRISSLLPGDVDVLKEN